MDYLEYIEINPQVMLGKPVIRGTRITVELILDKLSVGETYDEVLDEHPRLKREHIFAALAYAARTLKGELVFALAA